MRRKYNTLNNHPTRPSPAHLARIDTGRNCHILNRFPLLLFDYPVGHERASRPILDSIPPFPNIPALFSHPFVSLFILAPHAIRSSHKPHPPLSEPSPTLTSKLPRNLSNDMQSNDREDKDERQDQHDDGIDFESGGFVGVESCELKHTD